MDGAPPDPRVTAFWCQYLAICETHMVPASARPWYRQRLQRYIDAHPGIRLRAHTPAMVEAYLELQRQNLAMPGWQFRQAVDALRLLFCHLLQVSWGQEIDWAHWKLGTREPGVTPSILPGSSEA